MIAAEVGANIGAAIYATGTLLVITALVCSRRFERLMAGARNRLPRPFRGADPARRMSPGYLSRHPNVAAHLADDTTETKEAA